MATRKLNGPLGGDYQTDGAGNAVLLNSYPLTQEDDVPLRLADHEARVTATEAITTVLGSNGSLRARNRMVVTLGDSIAGVGINGYGPTDNHWLASACLQLNGALQWAGVYSYAGQTTAYIRANGVPDLLAADVLPGYAAVMCGANDGYNMATFRTEYSGILDALLGAGVIPIVCALCPNDTSGNHVKIHACNTWLSRECARRGLVFVNWMGALVDQATAGKWASGYSSDGVHPNSTATSAMATALADAMEQYFAGNVSVEPYLANCNLDPSTLLLANATPRNCLMLTDTGSNGSADGWAIVNSGSAAATLSLESPSSGDVLGKWQRLTRADNDGSNNSRLWTPTPFAGVTPGDRLAFGFRLAAVIESASPAGTLGSFSLHDGAAGPLGTDPRRGIIGSGWATDIPASTMYQEVVVRSGVSGAFIMTNLVSGEGYYQIGQVTLRNLTALGID